MRHGQCGVVACVKRVRKAPSPIGNRCLADCAASRSEHTPARHRRLINSTAGAGDRPAVGHEHGAKGARHRVQDTPVHRQRLSARRPDTGAYTRDNPAGSHQQIGEVDSDVRQGEGLYAGRPASSTQCDIGIEDRGIGLEIKRDRVSARRCDQDDIVRCGQPMRTPVVGDAPLAAARVGPGDGRRIGRVADHEQCHSGKQDGSAIHCCHVMSRLLEW